MQRASRRTVATSVLIAGFALGGAASPAVADPGARAAQADLEPVILDQELVRLNTSNPPGNEAQVADYMRDRLAPLGFEVDVIPTPTPGKAHLIARLRSANPVGKRCCSRPTRTPSASSRTCGAWTRSRG